MKKTAIDKYLKNYAEAEINSLFTIDKKWEQVIVIPAHNEYTELLEVLNHSIPRVVAVAKEPLLVILVVNGSIDSNTQVHETNLKLLNYLKSLSHFELSDLLSLVKYQNYDLLIVNRAIAEKLFNKKSGVGLARKIGADLALALYQQGKIISPWIRNTDADVILPEDYLSVNPDPDKYSAVTYPFYHQHLLENNLGHALQLYETYLRYYFLGLIWAGSPYAFHTVGSSMAVSAEAYARVRGFPGAREAAEDFYMLNKLAKVAPVFRSTSAVIQIRGRESDRVPFGTGASMLKISSLLGSGEEYYIYNPQIFDLLKKWYEIIDTFIKNRDFDKLLNQSDPMGKKIMAAVEKLGGGAALKNATEQSANPLVIKRHIHTWFDGFRTLRFIHILSADYLPPLNWHIALENSRFINLKNIMELNIEEVRKELFHIELEITGKYQKSILSI
jgi:hypothetical protein